VTQGEDVVNINKQHLIILEPVILRGLA
jgi:hypothetical protein